MSISIYTFTIYIVKILDTKFSIVMDLLLDIMLCITL